MNLNPRLKQRRRPQWIKNLALENFSSFTKRIAWASYGRRFSYRMKLTTVKPWRICWHWSDSLLHTLGLLQPEDNQCESSWDLEVGSTHPPGKTCRFLIILKLPKLVGQTLSTGNQVLRTHSRPSSCWTREQREGWFLFSVLALLLPTLQLLRIGLGFWW